MKVILIQMKLNIKLLSLPLFPSFSVPTESEGLLNAECFDWLTLEQTKILIYLVCACVYKIHCNVHVHVHVCILLYMYSWYNVWYMYMCTVFSYFGTCT